MVLHRLDGLAVLGGLGVIGGLGGLAGLAGLAGSDLQPLGGGAAFRLTLRIDRFRICSPDFNFRNAEKRPVSTGPCARPVAYRILSASSNAPGPRR